MTDSNDIVSGTNDDKWFTPYGYEVPKYNIVSGEFAIMPRDMPSEFDHLWSAFKNSETEVSAAYILRYCQQQGDWTPFTIEQINAFYQRKPKHSEFTFNRLVEPDWNYGMPGERNLTGGGWIVLVDGLHYVTDDFIYCVHRSLSKS
jgi:hypothetical protein